MLVGKSFFCIELFLFVFLHLTSAVAQISAVHGSWVVLLDVFETFGQVVLNGSNGGADGGTAEAVGDEAEVRQVALYCGLQ